MHIVPSLNPQSNLFFTTRLNFNYRLGIPNSLREALLKANLGEAALVLDALFSINYKVGGLVSFQTALTRLQAAGVFFSPALFRRALNSGIFKPGRARKQKGRGRPTKTYYMPSVEALVSRFAGGFWSSCDALQPEDLASLKAYRSALHREFIRRAPGAYSRAFLSSRLGISKRTTRNYDAAENIEVEARFNEAEIQIAFDWTDYGGHKPQILDKERLMQARKGAAHLLVKWADGRQKKFPLRLGIVYRYSRDVSMGNARVFLVQQLTNHYHVRSDGADLLPY